MTYAMPPMTDTPPASRIGHWWPNCAAARRRAVTSYAAPPTKAQTLKTNNVRDDPRRDHAKGDGAGRGIGARLFASPRTVEWHPRQVFMKLELRSRRELSIASASRSRPDRRSGARLGRGGAVSHYRCFLDEP